MSFRDGSSRSSSVATTGSRPTNSGIRPYFKRSSGSTSRKISPVPRSSGAITLAPKPIELDRLRAEMIFSSPLKAPPHTNRMLVVSTCRNSCCGCLRPPCGGTDAMVPSMILSSACCTPSPETSRVIESVVGLAADLVDLVDIDDAALGALDIVVGRLQQLEDDVLDILADIAGFGERRRIRHGEGHIEDARQRLRQQRLAGAGRPDQQDVGLRELDIVVLGLMVEPLVVIVNGDREHLLGVILTDHVVIENLADLLRAWECRRATSPARICSPRE